MILHLKKLEKTTFNFTSKREVFWIFCATIVSSQWWFISICHSFIRVVFSIDRLLSIPIILLNFVGLGLLKQNPFYYFKDYKHIYLIIYCYLQMIFYEKCLWEWSQEWSWHMTRTNNNTHVWRQEWTFYAMVYASLKARN